jgi:hypothetical protein
MTAPNSPPRIPVILGIVLALGPLPLPAQSPAAVAGDSGFAHLIGTWQAVGDGFTSRLTYTWALPGLMVRASNQLTAPDGRVLMQYEGAYFRNPATGAWRFHTIGGGGELHDGTATWRDGKLWHEAVVHGGAVQGYSSVVVPGSDTMRYHARYSPGAAEPGLLDLEPLTYLRQVRQPD